MERQELIEWVVGIAMAVVGSALALRSRHWSGVFSSMIAHPLSPFLSGLYGLLIGLLVGLAHNLWVRDARVIVTVLGWMAAAWGAMVLLAPEIYHALIRKTGVTPRLLIIKGCVRIVLGAALILHLLTH